ncbi:MAG: lysophospholipid acyltransferase family protein [Planctomycetota bacterium]
MKKFREPRPPMFIGRLGEFIEYYLLRIITSFLLALPLDYSLKVARLLGETFNAFSIKFRKRGYQHLKMAYPSKTPDEIRHILKGVFEHFGMILVEILSFPRKIRLYNYDKYLEIKGIELIDEGLKKGNGVILISAHFGNWELCGYMMSMMGYQLISVARFMPNPLVDSLLNYSRRYQGQKIIYKENALKDMMKTLKDNKILGMIVDQDARSSGIFVDFMGMKSSTIPSPALLHLRFNSPIILFTCCRSKANKFCYTLSFERCILPEIKSETAVQQITQSYTSQIENAIHKHPEQWMWLHRRWKTKP